jgi:hypothetical protein
VPQPNGGISWSVGDGHRAEEAGMDTEHRAIAELLALKNAPDDMLLDQV